MDWKIKQDSFQSDRITSNGNRFLLGNGYMGVRGTLEEYTKDQLVAINLAGKYDKVKDGWREPLNALNGLYTYPVIGGKSYILPKIKPLQHTQSLDFYYGIGSRMTKWQTEYGMLKIESKRIASMSDVHILAMRYQVTTDFTGEVTLFTGIDGDIWDIYGPHLIQIDYQQKEDGIKAIARTQEKKSRLSLEERFLFDAAYEMEFEKKDKKYLRKLTFMAQANTCYTLDKFIGIYMDEDEQNFEKMAEKSANYALKCGFEECLDHHKKRWEDIWKYSMVTIEGDEEAMIRLNYSCYHLQSIAPRNEKPMSIAARGLSGQTYKGAVFWDTEMFMLDYFLFTEPNVARSLVRYRIDTLSGARKKAQSYGYEGAFYAWESQEDGFDACSDYNITDVFTKRPMRTYFRDKQIHISAAVVYGLCRYIEITGDTLILEEGGFEVVIECAQFYYSLLLKKEQTGEYVIHDVIGPDEYHERVNNNGYTNRMVLFTFQKAIQLLEEAKIEEYKGESVKIWMKRFQNVVEHLYIPFPGKDKVIPQFDGYRSLEDVSIEEVKSRLLHEKEYWGGAYGVASDTQIIKQADVVTWLNLFSKDFSKDVLLANWNFYEPRTEHGSSLSACMYAMLACKCNMPQKAYPFFLKTASSDYMGGGKEWAGLVYIGGTHPAAAGGAYMTAIEGFAGMMIEEGKPVFRPRLPEGWKGMDFYVRVLGKLYHVKIKGNQSTVTDVS